MIENNFYPEVLEITDTNKENIDDMLNIVSGHLTSTMRNSDKLLNIMQKFKEAVDKDLENITGEGAESSSSEEENLEEKDNDLDGNLDNISF